MPSGKMWYRRPSKPGRPPLPRSDYAESCLTSLHSRQGWNSTGLNTFWWSHPPSSSLAPLHIKANPTSQGLTLSGSVHMGTSAQTQPTLARITLRRTKHPMCTAKKKKSLASLVAQSVKNLPAMWETWVQSQGWEDPLEKGTAIYCSILAWRIPMDRGDWRATVHGVAKSGTRLSTAQHS